MTREVILPRLMQRYAAEGTKQSYAACAQLLSSAPTPGEAGPGAEKTNTLIQLFEVLFTFIGTGNLSVVRAALPHSRHLGAPLFHQILLQLLC